jgi:hypothetical protein
MGGTHVTEPDDQNLHSIGHPALPLRLVLTRAAHGPPADIGSADQAGTAWSNMCALMSSTSIAANGSLSL